MYEFTAPDGSHTQSCATDDSAQAARAKPLRNAAETRPRPGLEHTRYAS